MKNASWQGMFCPAERKKSLGLGCSSLQKATGCSQQSNPDLVAVTVPVALDFSIRVVFRVLPMVALMGVPRSIRAGNPLVFLILFRFLRLRLLAVDIVLDCLIDVAGLTDDWAEFDVVL